MLINSIVSIIGQSYFLGVKFYNIIGIILSILVFHRTIYFIVGLLWTRKFPDSKKNHKYAILIAARNEEKVIGNLLDSIKKQDYPSELLTIFVVADNCTDDTAKIARRNGAICYERFDDYHKTKGFALEFLFDRIEEDYKRDSFEGFFVFDADNLLNKNYISKMNNAFDAGEKVITSYRNTKNFDENWIASTYALHWIRSARINHRARSVFHLATNIQGTGFLFANELVKDGWHFTSLTEDRAFTAVAVAKGYPISYQDEAEFFDEQPISLKIACRQRLRWSKGHLLAFKETGPLLFTNIIFGRLFLPQKKHKESIFKRIIESIRHRFASFDTLAQLTPIAVINLFRWLLVSVLIYACYCFSNGLQSENVFAGSTWLAKALTYVFGKNPIFIEPGLNAFFVCIMLALWLRLLYRLGSYLVNTWMAIYIFIVERRRIKKIPITKKILYILTFPTFDIIGRYTMYLALFVNVTWKPIPHTSKVTINDVR